MAIKINFDATQNPENPTLVLAKKNGDKLGLLNAQAIEVSDALNDASEITFNVYKYVDNKKCELWEEIVDFKLVYCVEWDVWFEIKVELDETTETVKTVFCTRLGYAELSQIMLYDIEINTENDIARDDYKIPTVLYNASRPEASLLHRITEKAPHYQVIHVDSTIAKIQRTFTFKDISICDAFNTIEEEIHCLIVLDSNSDENGRIQRTISVYDLESNCNECGNRGEFTGVCPKCGSSNINEGYGDDTNILITADELADSIQLSSNTDAIKNCFKVEGGDDLVTATIRNCNPNGTDYIWYISDSTKADMSNELVEKIESYDALNAYYQKDYVVSLDTNMIKQYNSLVEKYKEYNGDLGTISTPIKGYPSLMGAYYNTIDLAIYLQSGLMPSVEISGTSATSEATKLTAANLSPVSVNTIADISVATANNAVLAMAKTIVDSRYKVKVATSYLESGTTSKTWIGNFILTNYSDEEDTATSETISVVVDDNYSSFVQQRIDKLLNKDDADDLSVTGLFKKDYNDFVAELKKYSLDSLTSLHNSCQGCIDILIEQGAGNEETWDGQKPNLYEELYVPYIQKLSAIEAEIKVRQEEVDSIVGVYNNDNELKTYGLQTYIEQARDNIQKILDFQSYLGYDLWLEFCTFRREGKYSNKNYISDGLNNAELFKRTYELIEMAQKEIYKSAELQHSITTTLKNLLTIEKFKSLIKDFEVGNWLRVMVDDELYKLRLIHYSIKYDSIDDISVEFSDVVKASSSIKSVQEVLKQASSMATSYSYVQRQAQQGEKSQAIIKDWISEGLDATNTKIIGGADNQSQTWDEHGMLFRKYEPITETYDDIQLKIINSTMAITDDGWKSVKTAVGAYYYFHPVTKELTRAYGVNGEVIVGRILLGEQLGIYNDSGSLSFDDNGFLITNGTNSFRVNPNSEVLLAISNTTQDVFYIDKNGKLHISGDGSGLDISANSNITGMSSQIIQNAEAITAEVKRATGAEKNLSTRIEITEKGLTSKVSAGEIISTINQSAETVSISASKIKFEGLVTANDNFKILEDGSIEATNAAISGDITTNNIIATGGTIGGCSIVDGVLQIKSANADGITANDVDISGKITASDGEIGGWSIVDYKIYAGDGTTIKTACVQAPTNSATWVFAAGGTDHSDYSDCPFRVDKDGNLHSTSATIEGKITATSGTIGGCEISDKGVLQIKNANIVEKLTADKIDVSSLTADSILVKDSNNNTLLSAGDKKVSIAGWNVDNNSFYSGSTFSSSDCFLCTGSTGTSGTMSIGGSGSISGWMLKAGSDFGVTKSGTLYASDAYISGKITASDGEIGGWNIDKCALWTGASLSSAKCLLSKGNLSLSGVSFSVAGSSKLSTWMLKAGDNFGVTSDGVVYARSGFISGWELAEHAFQSGQSYMSSQGTFLFRPSDASVGYSCGFLETSENSGIYNLILGANTQLKIGDTTLSEAQLKKLLALI